MRNTTEPISFISRLDLRNLRYFPHCGMSGILVRFMLWVWDNFVVRNSSDAATLILFLKDTEEYLKFKYKNITVDVFYRQSYPEFFLRSYIETTKSETDTSRIFICKVSVSFCIKRKCESKIWILGAQSPWWKNPLKKGIRQVV